MDTELGMVFSLTTNVKVIKRTKDTMKDIIVLLRTLYLISVNSEKHEVIIDEETLKIILDQLKDTLKQYDRGGVHHGIKRHH